MAVQPTIASAPVAVAQDVHQDTTVKLFLLGAVGYFAIVGVIALIIAAKFVWPEFLGTISYFTYGRMRPLHVNGMLFGWLLAADMGLAYYIVPRLCGVKLWSEKLGIATSILWNSSSSAPSFLSSADIKKGLNTQTFRPPSLSLSSLPG